MITNVRKTPVLFVFLIPMVSLLGSGCAGYRIVRTVQAEPMKTTSTAPQTHQENPQTQSHEHSRATSQQDQTTMAAIEDFLQRTQEFQDNDTLSTSTQRGSAATEMPRGYASQIESTRRAHGYPEPASQPSFPRGMIVTNAKVGLDPQRSTEPTLALPVVQSMAISLAASVQHATSEPTQTNTVNQSLEVSSDLQPFSLDHYVSQLESQASTSQDFESEWRLRLLQLVMGRDDRAMVVSDHLSAGSRSLIQSMMRVAISVRNALRNPSSDTEKALTQVDELRQMIAQQSDPVVTTIALCKQVVTFGVYDEMSQADLIAGRTTQIIVYSEIENFSSDSIGNGQYETRLGSRLELLTAEGRSVWQKEEPEIVDRCRRRRRDFFIAQRVTFPASLTAGHYVLKVMVEDKISGRANEAIHPFEIIGPTSIAQNN